MNRPTRLLASALLCSAASGCGREAAGPVTASGVLEAREIVVSSASTGTVLRVHAGEGDAVDSSAVLVEIDVEKLRTQRAQASAALDGARATVRAADRALAQTAIRRENVARTRARVAALVSDTAATRQRLDDVDAEWRALVEGEVAARAQRDAARARGDEAGAHARLVEQQIAEATVRAPARGVVLTRFVETGEFARPGVPLYAIGDLAHMWVRVYVSEHDVGRVRLGAPVRVAVDALRGRPLAGRVTWIASRAEFTPKNVQTRDARAELVYAVKVAVDNPDGSLAIGMPADVTFAEP